MPALWETPPSYPGSMRAIFIFVILGTVGAGLCGCMSLAAAVVGGLVGGGKSGLPAAHAPTSPFVRESPWVKEHNPELYEASKAAILEECRKKLAELDPQSSPGVGGEKGGESPGLATTAETSASGCTRRKVCLPGNRIPAEVLVCGAGWRARLEEGKPAAAQGAASDWSWGNGRSDPPASSPGDSGSPPPPAGGSLER